MGKVRVIIFLVYLLIGLYLMNSAFVLIEIPETMGALNKWVVAIAGVLVIFSGVHHLVVKHKKP